MLLVNVSGITASERNYIYHIPSVFFFVFFFTAKKIFQINISFHLVQKYTGLKA